MVFPSDTLSLFRFVSFAERIEIELVLIFHPTRCRFFVSFAERIEIEFFFLDRTGLCVSFVLLGELNSNGFHVVIGYVRM